MLTYKKGTNIRGENNNRMMDPPQWFLQSEYAEITKERK